MIGSLLILGVVVVAAINGLWAGVRLWRAASPAWPKFARVQGVLLVLSVVCVCLSLLSPLAVRDSFNEVVGTVGREGGAPGSKPPVPDILKQDCQRLVDGLLLFEPSKTMRQGQPYFIFARLSRNPAVNITEGLGSSDFVIRKESVSCKVSMALDSQEPNAFNIEKVPAGRKDDQLLEADKFAEWDWRVIPRIHGTLHLLLYVTPMLYVDDVGEGLTSNPQAPNVITVTPDYIYESTQFLMNNWTIIGGLLSAVFIPLFLWFRTGIIEGIKKRFKKKKAIGFINKSPS